MGVGGRVVGRVTAEGWARLAHRKADASKKMGGREREMGRSKGKGRERGGIGFVVVRGLGVSRVDVRKDQTPKGGNELDWLSS